MIFLVIPVHNNWCHTRNCLTLLARQDHREVHIVVVDDGSTDGTKVGLNEEFPSVERLEGDGDLWWSGAVQKGIDHLTPRLKPTDHLLLLNNDTDFPPQLISRLLESSDVLGGGIVGAACRSYQRQTMLDAGGSYHWATCTRISTMKLMEISSRKSGLLPVDFLMSRAVLYPASCFLDSEGFDTAALPHYHADMVFTHQARERGFPLVVDLDTEILVHETEATSGAQFGREPFSSRHAWEILISRKSSFQPLYWARAVDRCCPPEHRLANKLSFFRAALAHSFGKTVYGSFLLKFYRALEDRLF